MSRTQPLNKQTTSRTLHYYWQATRQYTKLAGYTFGVFFVGSTLQDVIAPLLVAQAINKLVSIAHQPLAEPVWCTFLPYVIGLVIVAVLGQRLFANALRHFSVLQLNIRVLLDNKVYNHLLQQSLNFHANSFGGSLVTDANKFSQSYVLFTDVLFLQCGQLFVKFIVALGIISIFCWPIAIALFVWTLFYMWLSIKQFNSRSPLARQAARSDSLATAHLADTVTNINVVQSFAQEQTERQRFDTKAQQRSDDRLVLWHTAIRDVSITATLIIFIQVLVLVMSIYFVLHHRLALGTLVLIQVYIAQLIAMLRNFGVITRTIEQALMDAVEMTKILDKIPEIRDTQEPVSLPRTKGSIDFKAVSFAYTESDGSEHLFKDFGLHIPAGEKVGLVGHSGAGKTTLAKLLLRFMDVDDGAITVDGYDIKQVRQAELRAQIAYVPQEPLLFHRTIAENIAYGTPTTTLKAIKAAAKQAYADDFIRTLPNGYQTMVGERGVKLSGGQRQRIAIARAIVKNAPILLLDEATSALDSESERAIQKALASLMKGRTTIVIAHRLSTIQKMDRIIVMENGSIIEDGPHKTLLQRKGQYAQLWAHQSGGFMEE